MWLSAKKYHRINCFKRQSERFFFHTKSCRLIPAELLCFQQLWKIGNSTDEAYEVKLFGTSEYRQMSIFFHCEDNLNAILISSCLYAILQMLFFFLNLWFTLLRYLILRFYPISYLIFFTKPNKQHYLENTRDGTDNCFSCQVMQSFKRRATGTIACIPRQQCLHLGWHQSHLKWSQHKIAGKRPYLNLPSC